MASINGTCHICGAIGPLSFEHIPPKRAFNNQRIFVAYGEQLFTGAKREDLRTTQYQSGAGDYTLCENCNSLTGGWYAKEFSKWAESASLFLHRMNFEPSGTHAYEMYPLRVLKQIVTMFFSINSNKFHKKNSDLVRFILNKCDTGLPDDIRVFAGYTHSTKSRMCGVSGLLNNSDASGNLRTHTLSEYAFTPFVFVMTHRSDCPDPRLQDISNFAKYTFDEKALIYLRLPMLEIRSPYPTDYRTEQELRALGLNPL